METFLSIAAGGVVAVVVIYFVEKWKRKKFREIEAEFEKRCGPNGCRVVEVK